MGGDRAGCGVYEETTGRKFSFRLPGALQTNNRAELFAVIKALELMVLDNYSDVILYTDSKYIVDAINIYLPKWKLNGYRTTTGFVKNQDLITRLDENIQKIKCCIPFTLQWIKAHHNSEGNIIADKLAVNGTMLNHVEFL